MSLFGWVFISAALAHFAKGFWLLTIALLDLGLAVLIATAAGMQGEFLPAMQRGCNGEKPIRWQVTGNEPSFFVLAAKLGKWKNPTEACNDLVQGWQIIVACV